MTEELLDGAAERRQTVDVEDGRQGAVEENRQEGDGRHHVGDVILAVSVHLRRESD